MTTLCIGHRGAKGHLPENTLPSFRRAIELGCDMIELDVHLVEDQLVVIHDNKVDRTTNGSGRVDSFSFEALREMDAGDGAHSHPTQALLDLYTMRDKKGDLEGKEVTILGDILFSRVARSNIWGLQKLGAKVTLCGPPTLVPKSLESMGCKVTYDVREAISNADIINLLRIQHERQQHSMFPSLGEYSKLFGLNRERLA